MLAPIKCPKCGHFHWVEFSISYEKLIYISPSTELAKLILKHINVKKIWDGQELLDELRSQFKRLVEEDKLTVQKAINELSELYGISPVDLEDVLSDLIEEAKVAQRGRAKK